MDVSAIIKACGGDGAVAACTSVATNTVAHWRRRGSIPPEHWEAIVSLGLQRGADVTLKHLASIRAARSRKRSAPLDTTNIPAQAEAQEAA